MSGKISHGNSGFSRAPKKLDGAMGPFMDFVDSDSPIAAIVFFILMAIVFAVLLSLGIKLVTAIFSPSQDPYLFKGMKSAEQPLIIEQDPSLSGSIPILRSQDQPDGIEFTWSIWMYISDLQYGYGKFKHVFHKGNVNFQHTATPPTPTPPTPGGCSSTEYGCCPDGTTAMNPPSQTPRCPNFPAVTGDCSSTQGGCCPDGTTAKSTSFDNCDASANCPAPSDESGLTSTFGCCPADAPSDASQPMADAIGSNCGYQDASNNNYDPTVEGMSNSGGCADSTLGCCDDGTTAKTDNDGTNCPGYDTTTGLNFPNNAPGLYIAPTTNDLVVVMNTFSTINEKVIIPDIPLNKWVNVIIRVEGDTLDVYINGGLDRRHQLGGVPKQNYGDVYVTMNGGFNGYVSCLRYFDKAIQPGEIQGIINRGPCMKQDDDKQLDWQPPYLSLRWYFQGPGGQAEMDNPPGYMP